MRLNQIDLIIKNDRARWMIESWPSLREYLVPFDPKKRLPRSIAGLWAKASGLSVHDVDRWSPMLFMNGIVTPDGSVSEIISGMLDRRAVSLLHHSVRPKPEKPEKKPEAPGV
jgi:hypothetical protein